MRVIRTEIPGTLIIEPVVQRDPRGYFLETFHQERFAAAGLPTHFVQDNHSASVRHTLRGLHLQLRHPQGKLIQVVEGEIWDVAVDVRPGSATFGRFTFTTLTAGNFRQLYVPPGCAHGFCVVSAMAQVQYKCTALYDPSDELGIAYDDPDLAIPWPVAAPLLSERDRRHPRLADVLERLDPLRLETPAPRA
ncbi:MAG TPA: dTDP-4-dehydrorhamnose 3,5-epimerase [Gemmatimonadaceae bacterium]